MFKVWYLPQLHSPFALVTVPLSLYKKKFLSTVCPALLFVFVPLAVLAEYFLGVSRQVRPPASGSITKKLLHCSPVPHYPVFGSPLIPGRRNINKYLTLISLYLILSLIHEIDDLEIVLYWYPVDLSQSWYHRMVEHKGTQAWAFFGHWSWISSQIVNPRQ